MSQHRQLEDHLWSSVWNQAPSKEFPSCDLAMKNRQNLGFGSSTTIPHPFLAPGQERKLGYLAVWPTSSVTAEGSCNNHFLLLFWSRKGKCEQDFQHKSWHKFHLVWKCCNSVKRHFAPLLVVGWGQCTYLSQPPHATLGSGIKVIWTGLNWLGSTPFVTFGRGVQGTSANASHPCWEALTYLPAQLVTGIVETHSCRHLIKDWMCSRKAVLPDFHTHNHGTGYHLDTIFTKIFQKEELQEWEKNDGKKILENRIDEHPQEGNLHWICLYLEEICVHTPFPLLEYRIVLYCCIYISRGQ